MLSSRLTDQLVAYGRGDPGALDALMPRVYEELRTLAHRHLANERHRHTLLTTDLVHEVYLKLVDGSRVQVRDKQHFFALASRAMRQVLIDHARSRLAAKRGGGGVPVTLDEGLAVSPDQTVALLDLDEALRRLEAESERRCRVVEYRFFGGLSLEEIAESLGVSLATVKREWTVARAWLNRELSARATS
jgi:RNA polymerase sigma factor (TIGR02999 family)